MLASGPYHMDGCAGLWPAPKYDPWRGGGGSNHSGNRWRDLWGDCEGKNYIPSLFILCRIYSSCFLCLRNISASDASLTISHVRCCCRSVSVQVLHLKSFYINIRSHCRYYCQICQCILRFVKVCEATKNCLVQHSSSISPHGTSLQNVHFMNRFDVVSWSVSKEKWSQFHCSYLISVLPSMRLCQ